MNVNAKIELTESDCNGILIEVRNALDTHKDEVTDNIREAAYERVRREIGFKVQAAFDMGREFERKHSS